ncbi:36348_t:CDS:2, partial [Gigaspora margarita]
NYANVYGYPSPGQHLQYNTQLIIYLPTNQDYTKVYTNFIEYLNIFPEKPFNKISYKKKELIQKKLDGHKQKAEIEQEYYCNNILTSTILPNTAHIFYNWVQNVPVLYSPQQIAQQLNYIIAKNEFPQGTGKGANTTISLVYNGLQ